MRLPAPKHYVSETFLKVTQDPSELNGGAIAALFEGRGMVRVLEHEPGRVLMERVTPGTQLVEHDGNDAEVIAAVIKAMQSSPIRTAAAPSAADWGRSLAYQGTGISAELLRKARDRYSSLVASQQSPRLLHGDLHHYNVLWDEGRGWLAIDPKGVLAELEYELGAMLRNPVEFPERFASRQIVERRIAVFTRELGIDPQRALHWAFAQAVLSAIWNMEDHGQVAAHDAGLLLATVLEPMIG